MRVLEQSELSCVTIDRAHLALCCLLEIRQLTELKTLKIWKALYCILESSKGNQNDGSSVKSMLLKFTNFLICIVFYLNLRQIKKTLCSVLLYAMEF